MDQLYDRDCTSKCRSSAHARDIFRCIPYATASQIRAYSVWMCHNFPLISDEMGRNILHISAACGKWEIVEWLLKNCNVEVDLKDHESGWTALHRSFFYGQLAASRVLCNLGASLRLTDHEGFSPLDIILKDRLPYIEYIPSHPCEVYAWGSNFNYNLGLGNAQSRPVPEVLEIFRKDSINIKQVVICKFHSAFLSSNGHVYTCGYGHGGRLGQGNEDISLMPSPVKGVGTLSCKEIAVGQDHLLMLMEGGQVWSCGLNVYHQLGHVPPSERSLVPKPLSLKFLKGKEVIGVRAARFHSVIYTKDCIYTFGLNAGQLGHPKGDRTQVNPRQVSSVFHESWNIMHVEASDGATVCATNRGDIFVLHEYQTRKIASKLLGIKKLSVVGGHLDSRCDVAGVREGGALELRVMLLTQCGKLYLWRQTDPYLRRCLFMTQKELIISDVHLNHYSVGLITTENEGYIGNIVPFKGSRTAPTTSLHTPTISSKVSRGLTVLLDTDECHFVKVKRLPHIYRGTFITSDAKGRNFAILQSNPKMGLIELPVISDSEILQDFTKLYEETFADDDFHDIIIKVGNREFAAHKFILASRSDFFRKQLASNNFEVETLGIENVLPDAVEQVLKFIYTNRCDFLTHGYEVNWNLQENGKKKKSTKTSKINPITILQEASRKLGMSVLAKRLDGVKLVNGQISIVESYPVERLSFNRHSLTQLADVNLLSSDGSLFPCHKCILAARLDYFHSMLSTSWIENSQLENLSLPMSSKVLEVILDFIYTDKASKIFDSEDPEFVCHVLLMTDQLLMPRLKEICEMALVELITLKNVAELLELASVYNSEQLKKSCMQFICINLAAIIETRTLDVLSDDVIQDLTNYYRNLVPSMNGRRIYYYNPPSHDTLEFVEKNYPIESASSFIRNRLDQHDTKVKSKNRSSSRSDIKDSSASTRNKTNSESSDKDIVLNIVTSEISALKIESSPSNKASSPVMEIETLPKESNRANSVHKPVIMHCPNADLFPSLEKALLDGQQKLTVLHKKSSSHDMKRIPHLSQKQKKRIESGKEKSTEITTPTSPSTRSSCPWAKLPQQSPPTPSFWDAVASKDGSSTFNSFPELNSKISNTSPNKLSRTKSVDGVQNNPEDIVLSLSEIQKAEEQKLLRTVQPKIKPLHILNIEDQAIEELLILYNAKDNPKERITISRVVPEEIASPVWKKHGF